MNEIDWDRVEKEAIGLLQDLIRIDTTNPPGNETEAAKYLEALLHKEGFETQILESAPGRGNLITRLKGSGDSPPLLLISHLDVVPADPSEWTHPPFAAEIADGCIWGRGAVDMKQTTIMELMTLLLLKRRGTKTNRDIILAAVADEEMGGELGAGWLVDNHPELLQSEYALNEMGGFTLHMNDRRYYPIQVAEKGLCWLKLTAKGEPGHGSVPQPASAVVALAEAVQRLGGTRLPQHNTDAADAFIRGIAARQAFPKSVVLEQLLNPYISSFILDNLFPDRATAARIGALLSNTANPTVLSAGSKTNVVPSTACAQVDGRLLPGQTPEDLMAEIRAVIGQEIELELIRSSEPASFRYDTPLYATLCDVLMSHDPEGIPIPMMVPGVTDSHHLARLGITCYGFSPLKLDKDLPFAGLFHGRDERIPLEGFRFGLVAMYEVVEQFCAVSS
jgi:acetylornithine deacetylase/succinyl-diaminopimelate desuccinylase-like protein